jgi:hypothetical protein
MRQITIGDLLDYISKYNIPRDKPIAVSAGKESCAFAAIAIEDDYSITLVGCE